jgi:CRP-like cAMP-binding protein
MTELRPFLRALPAFERFNEKQLDALISNLRVTSYPAGHQFIAQDTEGSAAYVIVSGVVEFIHQDSPESEIQLVREARDGEVFGLLSLVPNMPSPRTSIAKSVVVVAELPPERYHALFLLAPAVAHQLQFMVAVQLARDLQRKNQSLRQGLASQKPRSLLERLFGA